MSANGSRVVSVGHYQPEKILTNEDLAQMVDTNDEWIVSRVGIKERRIAADDEKVADMAVHAARQALENSGYAPGDIDMVIVATVSAKDTCPNTACRVAEALGIATPAAIDVNTACSGFEYALAQADMAIRTGSAKRAIVIGAEKLTAVTDWEDRSSCVLFGDGAGAVVVEGTDDPELAISPVVWGSEPSMSDVIRIEEDVPYIKQAGQTVFRWATTQLAPLIEQVAAKADLKVSDLAAFVPHQANLRIIQGIVKRLDFSDDCVIAEDIVYSGNTSAASVPLALSKLVQTGKVASGSPILLFGFGGGLTYAGQVIRCP
ncbi:beta-ketoacyl-ACP synthase III [Glycomyces buryatensis]|uniref:Beta-ketoacyl-[acyl-carrier-protein] synthase III n=1 Tax=Glycomyces buryatensis TaxID=2570927 RepID=A0A4S8PVS1_9ACTN|nr:beta-ketoacyl-ACP synthase III [Glycomyces buryatensis]THV33912.1 ketoacyl-ACP synthase III [Glycomyces buryatensis]